MKRIGGITQDEEVPVQIIKTAARVAYQAVKIFGEMERLDEETFIHGFTLGANWRQAGCPGILGIIAGGPDPDVEHIKTAIERIKTSPDPTGELEELSARENAILEATKGRASAKATWEDFNGEEDDSN